MRCPECAKNPPAHVKIVAAIAIFIVAISGCATEDNEGSSPSFSSDDTDESDDPSSFDPDNDDDDANPDDDDPADSGTDDDTTDVGDDDAAGDDDLDDDVECPNAFCVTEDTTPGADWECATDTCGCTAGYERFVEIAAPYAAPISDARLQEQLDAIAAGQVPLAAGRLGEAELEERILDALGIDFLLDGINGRPLTVTTQFVYDAGPYEEHYLVFEDPYVGRFETILLLPKNAPRPLPGIVGVHGHFDTAASFRDINHGRDFAEDGYAVLMPTMRVSCADENEDAVTRLMLKNGFAFYTVRAYETLLALKYLRYHAEVDGARVGLIGHSAGSMMGNLLVRVDGGFKAYVSDNIGAYFNWIDGPDGEDWIPDETTPALYPIHPSINDLSDARTPTLSVPYGYADEVGEILAFFGGLLHE
ncbi:MAG: dienelactone hydrolase family protein [Deltaproteobacteria bacterium]|nr:dienelactone hydrolase family protein [Deltaproteobacteria bacterium]